MDTEYLWRFLPIGYALTVLLEAPVLWFGLSATYTNRERLLAGFWLTACTYPIVVLVLPSLMLPFTSRGWYLLVAEIFAPVAECVLFRLGFVQPQVPPKTCWRDYGVIVLANLVSFLTGEVLHHVVLEWDEGLAANFHWSIQ